MSAPETSADATIDDMLNILPNVRDGIATLQPGSILGSIGPPHLCGAARLRAPLNWVTHSRRAYNSHLLAHMCDRALP